MRVGNVSKNFGPVTTLDDVTFEVQRGEVLGIIAQLTDGAGDPHYALTFVVREDRKNDPRILRFVAIYRSPEVKAFILDHYGKYLTPLW